VPQNASKADEALSTARCLAVTRCVLPAVQAETFNVQDGPNAGQL
jgi:hypothetical protein